MSARAAFPAPSERRARTRAGRRVSLFAGVALLAQVASVAAFAQAAPAQDIPPIQFAQSRSAELHEKNGLSIRIMFPADDAVIDQGITPAIPFNLAIASSTPVESISIHICEAMDGVSCAGAIIPPASLIVPLMEPYQAIWELTTVNVTATTSLHFQAWASVRNAAGETATSGTTNFTYIFPPSRHTTLLAPAHDTGFFAPASPVLWATMTLGDTDPATIDHMEFLDGSTVIGSITTPNSTPSGFALLWNDAPAGVHEVWARGVDSMGRVSATPTVSIYVVPPPGSITATLARPRTGEIYGVNAPIPMRATVTVSEGVIQRVEFVDGAMVITTIEHPPYEATWLAPSIGKHAISARAFDDLGNAIASPPAYVETLERPRMPIVIMTSPLQGSTWTHGAPIAFSSVVESPDVAITRVEYWADGVVIANVTGPPFAFSWTPSSSGTHSAAAVVYDAEGRRGTSVPVVLNVSANGGPPGDDPGGAPPSVALTAPAESASYVQGDTIALGANASQSGSSITRVDFTANGDIVATSTSSPWSANWSGVPAGDYTLVAVATNGNGVTAKSAAVHIEVAAAPTTITMAAPPAGATYYPGDAIGLRPATMHITGEVSRVDYYVDGALVGNSSAAPYAYEWNVDAPGTYNISAHVHDSGGNIGQSAPVAITVKQIAVHITSTADGANIDGPTVLVEGTYDGPGNTGVVVNNTVAVNDGKGHFFVNNVSLTAESNVLKATATSMGGSRVTASVTVSATVSADATDQRIFASDDEGIDTLSTRISVSNPSDIASWRAIDLVGGTMGAGTPGTEDIASLTFAAPGIYSPTMEVTDRQGNVTRKRIVVLVSSSTEVASARMATVNQFFDALLKQNKARALATLTSGLAGQFSSIYDALQDHWPEIIGSFDAVGATMYSTESFEAAVTRLHDGQKYLYLVEGMRDGDGVWRIDSF